MNPVQRLVEFVAQNYGKGKRFFTALEVMIAVEHYFTPCEIGNVVRNYERNHR